MKPHLLPIEESLIHSSSTPFIRPLFHSLPSGSFPMFCDIAIYPFSKYPFVFIGKKKKKPRRCILA